MAAFGYSRGYNRDHRVCKAKNVYYLALYRSNLPTSALILKANIFRMLTICYMDGFPHVLCHLIFTVTFEIMNILCYRRENGGSERRGDFSKATQQGKEGQSTEAAWFCTSHFSLPSTSGRGFCVLVGGNHVGLSASLPLGFIRQSPEEQLG